jgi:hypothetical protein
MTEQSACIMLESPAAEMFLLVMGEQRIVFLRMALAARRYIFRPALFCWDIPVVAAEDSEDPAYDNRDDEGLVLGSANLPLDDVAVDVVEQQGSDVVADGAELRDQDAEPDALCISLCLLL